MESENFTSEEIPRVDRRDSSTDAGVWLWRSVKVAAARIRAYVGRIKYGAPHVVSAAIAVILMYSINAVHAWRIGNLK